MSCGRYLGLKFTQQKYEKSIRGKVEERRRRMRRKSFRRRGAFIVHGRWSASNYIVLLGNCPSVRFRGHPSRVVTTGQLLSYQSLLLTSDMGEREETQEEDEE